MGFYIPSREQRKSVSGAPCPACTLHVHHLDLIAYAHPSGTVYMHGQCAALLTEESEQDVIPEESSAAAEE